MNIRKLLNYYSWKRIRQMFFLSLSNLPMPGHQVRPYFVRWGRLSENLDRSQLLLRR